MRDFGIINICILNKEYDIVDNFNTWGTVLKEARGFKLIRFTNERGTFITHGLTVDVECSGTTYTCLLNQHEKHLKIKRDFEQAVEDDRLIEDDNTRAEGSIEIPTDEGVIQA